MNPVLKKNTFFVKEHAGLFKASNNYDIYDPETERLLLECREEKLGLLTKILRFTGYKTLTPFNIEIKEPGGKTIITVKRGVSLFLSEVQVFDENEKEIGSFKQKLFSIGGKFDILSPEKALVCSLKGNWSGWDFKFEYEGKMFAQINKEWAGFKKEMFTTADNYMIRISGSVPENSELRSLIIGAAMCIDMVLKEK